jgi:hypothetical protein
MLRKDQMERNTFEYIGTRECSVVSHLFDSGLYSILSTNFTILDFDLEVEGMTVKPEIMAH